MTRVLLLGGYGGFGGRIARRLAADGHEVLVAGRDEAKARAFCGQDAQLQPVRVDRQAITAALEAHRPLILVDASGPFQTMDYDVPEACMRGGVHYLDIADGRDFVCNIGALDAAAKAAGVVLLSGASSVPALSGAAVRRLAEGMETVCAVEMAISASNRATAGPAVARAILGQAGQKVRLWRGRRWQVATAWQGGIREQFIVAGIRPLTGRHVALADVPDLALLPDRLPGRPAVTFRAGTELAFQNFGLRLGGRMVRWGLVRSLTPFAGLVLPLQRMTARMGSDRSAMIVRLFGLVQGRRVERRWTLIADDGDGPEIPALTVPLLVARIVAGAIAPGARDAGESLRLDDYEPAFADLAIADAVTEHACAPPLYARVMGARFDLLPPAARAMHVVLRDGGAQGQAEVAGPTNPLAAIIARIFGFPRAGVHDLHVDFAERDGVETWTRSFSGKPFHSRLSQKGRWLVERFGPFLFGFDLPSDDVGLTMIMRRWWLGPVRLPLALAPRTPAREWEEGGRFHFDVLIGLPVIGRLVHYRGWLEAD